jgi:transcriptional regulator with XRE-family HTH domain
MHQVSSNRDRICSERRASRGEIALAETKPVPNQKLRYERDRRGWSQLELADRIGTTPLNVGRWERGVTLPGPHFRQKLCEVFEKSAQELDLVPQNIDFDKATDLPLSTPAIQSSQEVRTPYWNVPYNRNLYFTSREDILAQLHDAFVNGEQPVALAQPQAISGLGGIVRHEAARVIVSCNNGVRTKPAVPPAVSLNGKAGRQQPVRSPLTTTLNRKVGSQTVRGDCYLLASKRIRS